MMKRAASSRIERPQSVHEPGLVRRVGVIDDEALLCFRIESVLEARGLAVRSLAGAEGVDALLEAFRPDLILLDIRLRTSDAFEVMKRLQALRFGGVVTLMSASPVDYMMDTMAAGEARGLRMGAPLAKPVEDADLFGAIEDAAFHLAGREIVQAARELDGRAARAQRLSLRDALDAGAVETWYQPKFAVATRAIIGAEALARGRTPSGDVVPPGELFAGATKRDMLELTDRVLAAAIAHTQALSRTAASLRLSVNVPVSFLAERDAPRLVRTAAAQRWWPGMIFEVTEDEALTSPAEVAEVATQLRLYGVELSLDDFGAGHSSLARLRDLPFREVKLDRSFVHGCGASGIKFAICRNVIALAVELGCASVAEGVEDEEDLAALRELGCDAAQGYHLARPMPFERFLALMEADDRPRPT